MLLRLAEDRCPVGLDDFALVVDRPERVTSSLDLVKQAQNLWWITLDVEFEHNHGVRKPPERSVHPFPNQGLRALGVDLDEIESRPVGADSVDGDGRELDAFGRAGGGPFGQ